MVGSDSQAGGQRNYGLDGILIINPRNYVARRENIERQLQARGLTYEFIHEHDADDLSESVRLKYFPDSVLSANAQSCAMKHFQALRTIAACGWKRALVLEDDAILSNDFAQGVQAAIAESAGFTHPHVLFIGSGGNLYTPRSLRVPGQRLYRASKGRLTEAYILGSDAARLRVEWMERHGIALPIDNLFERIDHELHIELYWLEEPVVEQGSKNGRFLSTIESAPPRFMQQLKFAFQKLRRKYLYQIWN
ncbi:MAG TPA: glycosyltransferase family 25 protein [Nitrospira sp.]|nr:glycosyltransferase family 25 protein [Nitrospira sp.]